MARFDIDAACRAHAQNIGEAETFDLTVRRDIDDMSFEWTSDKWDDGAPVTKWYGRNADVNLSLDKGIRLRGVTYAGKHTGIPMCEFYLNGVWYSDEGAEIMEYLG